MFPRSDKALQSLQQGRGVAQRGTELQKPALEQGLSAKKALEKQAMADTDKHCLAQEQILPLLQALQGWGEMVTIVFSGGSIFEFKGPFPTGSVAEGYYNLDGPTPGLHGHLRLDTLVRVRFQDRAHRGRASYAFVFEDGAGETVFKVFLGRDEKGNVLQHQLGEFERIRSTASV